MKNFAKRLKTMLSVDLQRLFTTPMFYILVGIAFALPVVMSVMINNVGGEGEVIANVWQMIGSAGGAMDMTNMTGMLNINMMFLLVAVLLCTFIADDFRSGFVKHLFAVRAKKSDYVTSKSIVGVVSGAVMIVAFLVGTLLSGAMLGMSFDTGAGIGVGNVVLCLLAKIFLMPVFCAVYVLISVLFKQRLYADILGSVAAGVLLFMTVGLISPLNATFMHFFLALAGGALFGVGIGVFSSWLLRKTDLV